MDATRVSFGADAATGACAAAGFDRRAEGPETREESLPSSAAGPPCTSAEGDGTDRTAMSGGGEAPDFPFGAGSGLAAGATACGAPAAATAPSASTTGGSHSGTVAGAALSPAISSRSKDGGVAPQWQPDGTRRTARRKSADIPFPVRPFTIRSCTPRSIRQPPAFPVERHPGRFPRVPPRLSPRFRIPFRPGPSRPRGEPPSKRRSFYHRPRSGGTNPAPGGAGGSPRPAPSPASGTRTRADTLPPSLPGGAGNIRPRRIRPPPPRTRKRTGGGRPPSPPR